MEGGALIGAWIAAALRAVTPLIFALLGETLVQRARQALRKCIERRHA